MTIKEVTNQRIQDLSNNECGEYVFVNYVDSPQIQVIIVKINNDKPHRTNRMYINNDTFETNVVPVKNIYEILKLLRGKESHWINMEKEFINYLYHCFDE